MTDYTKNTNFTAKDALTTGDANKLIKGSDFDAEFDEIATSIATKSDLASPTFTGTPAAPTAAVDTNTTQLATTAFVVAQITDQIPDTATLKANNLSDLASAVTARSNLGLGSIATQASSAVTITGGSVTGITDITVADGGTGSSTAAGARTNLGLGALSVLSSVAAAQIDAGAVHQGELNTSTETDTTTSTTATATTITNSAYGFLPRLKSNDAAGEGIFSLSATNRIFRYAGTSYGTEVYIASNNAAYTTSMQIVYVAASPPYNMGDGECRVFCYALIDNTTGNIVAVKFAPDPLWIHNGPTKVTADRYGKDGKQYIKQIILPPSLQDRPLPTAPMAQRLAFARDVAAYKRSPDRVIQEVELTPLMKNADMDLIPHPYKGNDLTNKTVVMLDPMSDTMNDLFELYENGNGEDVNQLIHDGYISIGNTPLPRKGPKGLMIVSADWKVTG